VDSWELLREAIDRVGVKAIAARLNVSTALVYKWCQEPRTTDDPDGSGARNPVDRVRLLYLLTKDERIINWLCSAAGGFFVPNPRADARDRDEQLLGTTQLMIQEFGQLLADISRSIENDGVITTPEAGTIRQSWERLKMQTEAFVVACERGQYAKPS
jgi:hypothetical protein